MLEWIGIFLLSQIIGGPAWALTYRVQNGLPVPQIEETGVQSLNSSFNVRAGKSTNSKILGQVRDFVNSGEFSIDTRVSDDGWYRVKTPAGEGWVHETALKAVDVKADYLIRSAPSIKSTHRGTIADNFLVQKGDAVFTGRTQIETNGSKKHVWHELLVHGESTWVHQKAMPAVTLDAAPEELALPSREVAKVSDEDKSDPAAVTPEKAKAEEKKLAEKAKPKKEPSCVGSLKEAGRSERFKKLLERGNPFTTWKGPWGANIQVKTSGQAVLNHPTKGAIPLTLSLCLDRREKPFITVNGTKVFFEDLQMTQIMVTDPTSGKVYEFERSRQ